MSLVWTLLRSLLVRTADRLADWYFHAGKPVLAACHHLAVEDKQVRSSSSSVLHCECLTSEISLTDGEKCDPKRTRMITRVT